MNLQKVVHDIKTLKIQGATAVAEAALRAWEASRNRAEAARLLSAARPTEPMLRNVLALAERGAKPKDILAQIEKDRQKIVELGAQKIENGMLIFTHCHSSTVCNILKLAKKQGKRFEVHNTETRPLYQGRITATELAKARIPITLHVDSAARLAMKKADVFLLGADCITVEGKCINKVGSEMFAEIAYARKIPVYICTHSLKFDPKTQFGFSEEIEKRHANEVWPRPPKGVKISNFAFEMISFDIITAIISELGVYSPENFIEEVKKKYQF